MQHLLVKHDLLMYHMELRVFEWIVIKICLAFGGSKTFIGATGVHHSHDMCGAMVAKCEYRGVVHSEYCSPDSRYSYSPIQTRCVLKNPMGFLLDSKFSST